jgi:hypothetical protein
MHLFDPCRHVRTAHDPFRHSPYRYLRLGVRAAGDGGHRRLQRPRLGPAQQTERGPGQGDDRQSRAGEWQGSPAPNPASFRRWIEEVMYGCCVAAPEETGVEWLRPRCAAIPDGRGSLRGVRFGALPCPRAEGHELVFWPEPVPRNAHDVASLIRPGSPAVSARLPRTHPFADLFPRSQPKRPAVAVLYTRISSNLSQLDKIVHFWRKSRRHLSHRG